MLGMSQDGTGMVAGAAGGGARRVGRPVHPAHVGRVVAEGRDAGSLGRGGDAERRHGQGDQQQLHAVNL